MLKSKMILVPIIALSISILLSGCTNTATTKVNIVATTDLHGEVTYNISEYIKKERKNDSNLTVVDAGDFYDRDSGGEMDEYFKLKYEAIKSGKNVDEELPIINQMKEVGYDSVTLGNHEFVSNNKSLLDGIIDDFNKKGIDVLSANTYNKDNASYTKPYTIKEIKTDKGVVKIGILGLTIKEVDEARTFDEKGNLVPNKSRELKDMDGYDGKLYMNDLVSEANKWVKVMKEKEKTDIIVATIHSGEKPKKPKNPGNRIQEIAQNVNGIDAIVAGHTHKTFEQHDYTNKEGENVIVTQPGSHGEAISKITLELEKKNGKWKIDDKYSKLTKFGKSKLDDNVGKLYVGMYSSKGGKEVTLNDISGFEWDKAYAFKRNTPKEEIYKTVGYKWKHIAKNKDKDIIHMVFMKDNKVVCYLCEEPQLLKINIEFKESDFKGNILEIVPGKNDTFKVSKNVDGYETKLTQQ